MQGRHLFPRGSYGCRGAACRSGIYCHRASIDVEGRHTGAAFYFPGAYRFRGAAFIPWGAYRRRGTVFISLGRLLVSMGCMQGRHLFPGLLSASRCGVQGRHLSPGAPTGVKGRHKGAHVYFPGAHIGVEGPHTGAAFIPQWRLSVWRGGNYFPGAPIDVEGRHTGAAFIPRGAYWYREAAYKGGIHFPGPLSASRVGIQGRHLFPGALTGIKRRHTGAAFISQGRRAASSGGIHRRHFYPALLSASRGGIQRRHLFPGAPIGVECRHTGVAFILRGA